jgi:hypothetical protein
LLAKVYDLTHASGGQLEYVGEWHSHPDGHNTLPSADDILVFSWLTERMDDGGLPALMAIVGQGNSSNWYIDEISPEAGWAVQ